MHGDVDLVPLFTRQFERCRVSPGEVVGVLCEPRSRSDYVSSATSAARVLGAEAFEVHVPGLGWDVPTVPRGNVAGVPALAQPTALLEAVKSSLERCDFVVDLIPETILHLPLREELKTADCRILTVVEPPDALDRMVPSDEIKQTVLAMGERLERTREVRATSKAGTDLHYTLGDSPVGMQYGVADEPGRWDHWPSALVAAYPIDNETRGTVVLDYGDMILPFKRYVESPITLTVEGGYITSIEGGFDATLMDEYLRSWENPEVYAMSHMALGLHPRAQWSALAFYEKNETIGMDGRSFQGNFFFSTGPNRWTGRYVEAHLDIPMRGCTVLLDGEAVVTDGVNVASEQLVATSSGL